MIQIHSKRNKQFFDDFAGICNQFKEISTSCDSLFGYQINTLFQKELIPKSQLRWSQ